jgi:glycosyltransferase involved in cell wall biosynthesis
MTSATPGLSIVIPAYNEAERIGRTLDSLSEALPTFPISWEILVIDDGSTDATAERVRSMAGADPRVTVRTEPHRGKGGAVRAGMLAARGDLRFLCDADLSMPVHELPRFLDLVPSRFDVLIGSREGQGAKRVGEPEHRHLIGRVFNALVRQMAVPGLRDTQCGFKMFTRQAAETIFPRVTIDGWAFDIEALVIARRKGLRVGELPIEWHYREQSRVSPVRDAFLMARDVLRIRARAMRGVYDR